METSQNTISVKPGAFRAIPKAGAFQPGNILRIKILELNGNRALIDFGAGRTTADIKIPVTIGEELLVKVQGTGDQPKLEPLSADAKLNSGTDLMVLRTPAAEPVERSLTKPDLRQLLLQLLAPDRDSGVAGHLRRGLELLNIYFESIDPEKRTSEMPSRLMSYANHSGVLFEKMLETVIRKTLNDSNSATPGQLSRHPEVQSLLNRDLKSILFTLKNVADDDFLLPRTVDSEPAGRLRKSIELMLGDIIRQQARAVRLSESSEPFQTFSFNLPLADDRQTAKLKVYYPKKQQSGPRPGFQVSLLLSMDYLGDLRADLYLLDRDLSLTFFVKNAASQSQIEQYQADLQDLLNPYFNQTVLRVLISEKRVEAFEYDDTEQVTDRQIDLRI